MECRGVSKLVDEALGLSLRDFGGLLARVLMPEGKEPDPMLLAGVAGGIIHVALHWIRHGYAPDVDTVAATALQLALVLKDRQRS